MLHATEGLRLAAACRNVLVPLDGSPEAGRALGTAEWLARRFGAKLHVVTVNAHADAGERHWFAPYLNDVTSIGRPVTIHCTAETDVKAAIRATSRALKSCVLCVATRDRSRTATLLGSAFAGVTVAGDDPLVAIGPQANGYLGPGPDPRRTVVCLDGGPLSEPLVDRAAMWARALDHRLTLATVVTDGHRGSAGSLVARLAADANIDDLDIDVLVLDGSGGPDAQLARHLAERPATLLAAATNGRAGAARAAHGSDTAGLVHHSPVPVLVLPPGCDPLAVSRAGRAADRPGHR